MKKLSNTDLVEEYFFKVKEDNPDLSLENIRDIVSTPYEMLKEDMSKGILSTIRLKYLGTFLVYPERAKAMLKHLTQRFKFHKIDKNEYFETKKAIEEHIQSHKKSI